MTSRPPFDPSWLHTCVLEPVLEGPPLRRLAFRRGGRAVLIYSPRWQIDGGHGHQLGRWYFRDPTDGTPGPRSLAFPSPEAALIAWYTATGPPAVIEPDPVDDDGGESTLEPAG